MSDSNSKLSLVEDYLKAEEVKASSTAVWYFLGGIIFGVVGAILCLKFGISEYWAEVPGSALATFGLLVMFINKSECEQTCDRMRDGADLTAKEFHKLRDILK